MIRSILIRAALCSLLLSGCGGPTRTVAPPAATTPTTPTYNPPQSTDAVELALNRAASADPSHAIGYTLDAAEELLRRGDTARAAATLAPLESRRLAGHQWLRLSLVAARIEIATGRADVAYARLTNPALEAELADAPEATRAEIGLARAEAGEAAGDALSAARERAYIQAWLSDPRAREQNALAMLRALARVDTRRLEAEHAHAEGEAWDAWIELALLGRDMRLPAAEQRTRLQDWQQRHANAPDLQPALALAAEMTRRLRAPSKVAILLPLTGKAAAGGRAVLDGYLAAYYRENGHQPAPVVAVIDTADTGGFAAAYKRAVGDGAELVVGPLIKEDLAQFSAGLRPLVPTVALNFGNETSFPGDLIYQFGLDVADEASQLAAAARQSGFDRAIVLTDRSQSAARSVSAFEQTWKAGGGSVIDTLALGDLNEYRLSLERTLLVDRSNARAQSLMRATQLQFEHEPRRREDVDLVALLADPASARSIHPMLAFLYAGDIPVWATSQIRSARADQERDHDLEGVRVLDMPWFSAGESELFALMATPRDTPAPVERLHALGADAQRLQTRLGVLGWLSPGRLNGATGELYLTRDTHTIARHEDWYVFTDGIAVPEPPHPDPGGWRQVEQHSREGVTEWKANAAAATSATPASASP